jgi:protein tyrosine/serine phosphatase
MSDEPQWLPLDGASNARDLGGLPTDSTGSIAPHRLLRSDNLQGLTPADVRLLVDDIGLRTVVDLRTNVEVSMEGPGPLTREPAVTIRHLSLFPESGGLTDVDPDAPLPWTRRPAAAAGPTGADAAGVAPQEVAGAGTAGTGGAGTGGAAAGAGPTVADALATGGGLPDPGSRSVAFYLGYLRDRPDNIVASLRAIADSDGATIVHCAAGKDRTGVVVAFALTVAGVPRDRIIADYAATADRMTELLARLRASDTYRDDLASRSDDSHVPRAATMERFLAYLDEHFGGPLGWLAAAGFGPEDVARLRSRLVPSAVAVQD